MAALASTDVIEVVGLTLRVTLLGTLLATLVGVPLGALIGVRSGHARRLFRTLLYALYSLPPVIAGLLGYLLLARGGWLGRYHLLFTPNAIVLVEVMLGAPLIAGLTVAALADVPRNVREAVASSGAAPLRAGWTLVKEARFGILSAIMVGFGRSLAEVAGALLVGGNVEHETRTLGTAILQDVGQGDFTDALTLGALLLALAFVTVAILAALQARSEVARDD